ncbi:MAG: winged helix-turn-helix domain-containing protein [Candidatus Levybacteria bacterium]|nr:winged helix-turn-helix domain-containing protein [Candidatus Levybacteria bacterium]
MVSNVEALAGQFGLRGFKDAQRLLMDAASEMRKKGTTPEQLKDIEGIYYHPLFSHNHETRNVVFGSGGKSLLSSRENELLIELEKMPNKFRSKAELLESVFGEGYSLDSVKKNIDRLRDKIEADPQNPRIITSRAKAGYMLNDSSRPPIEKELSQESLEEEVYHHPGFTYYPEKHLAVIGETETFLTPIENAILDFLSRHSNTTVTHEKLNDLWEDEGNGRDPKINVRKQIQLLRDKLDPDKKGRSSEYLVAVNGIGYMLINPRLNNNG